jgi:tRNA modification GTPase
MEKETIAAIATPIGSSGIGIIRISGGLSVSILESLFRRRRHGGSDADQPSGGSFPSHQMQYGYIVQPENGVIIDEVMVVAMHAPHSYTRENVVEIQTHAGAVILATILSLVLQHGARMAEPGEFTKRAFLNGRIDLSQAEAVADMVSVKTKAALNLAAVQLTGGMKDAVSELHDGIDSLRIAIEASIEFSDEIENDRSTGELMDALRNRIIRPIQRLIESYDDAHVLRDGIRIAIVGKPNVGKSSLLNCFLRRDRAIVTDRPGTTRDTVEDYMAIEGIPILITDTAGLHATADPVEQAGIKKTMESLEKADIVLFLVDGSSVRDDQDLAIWNQLVPSNTLLVVNKRDLMKHPDAYALEGFNGLEQHIKISAKFGHGIDSLKTRIKQACLAHDAIEPGQTIIPSLRQKIALGKTLAEIQRVEAALGGSFDSAMVMEDLNRAKKELNRISGEGINEDLLDQIFSKFCIGK